MPHPVNPSDIPVIHADGTKAPSTRVDGYVGKWFVDIGDRVHQGQVLATIETPDLDAQYEAAQHQLVVSQSQVDVVKANAAFAKSTYDRWRDSPKGVVSEQEREEKKAEYASSVAELKSAEAKVSARPGGCPSSPCY